MSYRLALAMGRTVKELSATIDPEEWIGWLAFYSLEPWGCAVEDDRYEKVCRLLENSMFGSGQTNPQPFFDRDPTPVKPMTLDEKIKGVFAQMKADRLANSINN